MAHSPPLGSDTAHMRTTNTPEPPVADDRESQNLRKLLEKSSWHGLDLVSKSPAHRELEIPTHHFDNLGLHVSDRWLYISSNGTIFQGIWRRKALRKSLSPDWLTIRDLRSDFTDDGGSSVIIQRREPEFVDAVEADVERDELYARSQRIMRWLARATHLTDWPQPTPTPTNWEGWRIKVKSFPNSFEIVALTETSDGDYLQKLLAKGEKTKYGVDLMMFHDDPAKYDELWNIPLELESGLMHLAVLYFSMERWEVMPPPPAPSVGH